MKTHASLPDCRIINNTLSQFVPMTSRWRRHYTVKAVSKVGKFSDTTCSILMLRHGYFYAEKQHSNRVLPFGAMGSGNYASPYITSLLVCHTAHLLCLFVNDMLYLWQIKIGSACFSILLFVASLKIKRNNVNHSFAAVSWWVRLSVIRSSINYFLSCQCCGARYLYIIAFTYCWFR